jgi:hypothetical protein
MIDSELLVKNILNIICEIGSFIENDNDLVNLL